MFCSLKESSVKLALRLLPRGEHELPLCSQLMINDPNLHLLFFFFLVINPITLWHFLSNESFLIFALFTSWQSNLALWQADELFWIITSTSICICQAGPNSTRPRQRFSKWGTWTPTRSRWAVAWGIHKISGIHDYAVIFGIQCWLYLQVERGHTHSFEMNWDVEYNLSIQTYTPRRRAQLQIKSHRFTSCHFSQRIKVCLWVLYCAYKTVPLMLVLIAS